MHESFFAMEALHSFANSETVWSTEANLLKDLCDYAKVYLPKSH